MQWELHRLAPLDKAKYVRQEIEVGAKVMIQGRNTPNEQKYGSMTLTPQAFYETRGGRPIENINHFDPPMPDHVESSILRGIMWVR